MNKSVKCVVVGDGAVGKTSLLNSYSTGEFNKCYMPTIIDYVTVNVMVNDMRVHLEVWETG